MSVDAGLRELRMVKHPEELELVRQAGALSDWGQERYRENIRPGRLAQELDYAMGAELMSEAADRFPGDNVEPCSCASPARTRRPRTAAAARRGRGSRRAT